MVVKDARLGRGSICPSVVVKDWMTKAKCGER